MPRIVVVPDSFSMSRTAFHARHLIQRGYCWTSQLAPGVPVSTPKVDLSPLLRPPLLRRESIRGQQKMSLLMITFLEEP